MTLLKTVPNFTLPISLDPFKRIIKSLANRLSASFAVCSNIILVPAPSLM
jgi:hypothetical protein